MDEMNLTDSLKLLRDYTDRGDEVAFRKLVEQYIDLVYSAALRRVGGDSSLAQDVTQTVFTDLARKAKSLRGVEMLGGWLYRYTGFVASNMVRGEKRRQIREQQAAQMNATSESPDALWQQLAPVLDDTIDALEPSDRQAVLLRFFEQRDFRTIGAMLGISDDAAQKRVSRALEKLRALLTERGVTLSVVVLSGFLANKVVNAAPAELVAKIARIALAGAATQAGLGWTLLHLTRSLSFKIALGGAVVVITLWLYLGHRQTPTNKPEHPLTPAAAVTLAGTTNVSASNQATVMAMAPPSQNNNTNTTGNVLLLNIVAADSGQPIPNVELDYWLWAKGKVKHKKPLETTRMGVCKVPVPDNTTELILVSERDGFADTLLDWKTDHGEQIPAQYTLKVNRAVPISGQVVDPDHNPVAGALVSFGNQTVAGSETRPQSDDFGWPYYVTTTTDSQGRWQVNRIGKEALKTITGGARHPDFVLTRFDSPSDPIQKQLLDGTYVFTLGRAVVVRGTVKDPNGTPIADADVLVGHVSMDTSRSAKSQSDGSFSIAGCKPERTLLTAQAKGFAAATIKVNLGDKSGSCDLVLQPGKMLKLRLVDQNGNPIPDADVWYDAYPNHQYDANDPEKYAVTQVDLHRKTDKNGRLEWDEAPEGDLVFEIAAGGYMRNNEVRIPADGIEHVVTLQQGLTIAGIVVDATTGQPIPRFRIITGWPNIDPVNNTTNASWSTIDRFWLSFNGGKFQYTYEEEVLGGVKDPAFIFKFEADGYAPFITRVVPASEGSARFDVALTPAQAAAVTVLSPDGGPAVGVDIGLVSPGARLSLMPGGFSRNNVQSGGTLLTTDNQGQFVLSADPAVTKVIAASPQGYAEVTPVELTANPVINLLPWGRLEGTYQTNGQPLADRMLSIQYGQKSFDAITCNSAAFQTKTDGNGHFTFAQVPPGKHEVSLIVPFDGNMSRGWSELPLQTVTISAGASTTITIDETNTIARKMFFGN